jgi:hypothetical protein
MFSLVQAFRPEAIPLKTGRNDPCSCGSGKKFKSCCLGRGAGEPPERVSQRINVTAHGQSSGPGKHLLGGLVRERVFLRLITGIDGELREQGVPIPDRPEAAIKAAEAETRQALPTDVPDRDPRPDTYSGEDMVIRIRRWYQQHYSGALGPAVRIETEADFQREIERIDQKLSARGVSIPARPLAALCDISDLTKAELRICSVDRDPLPGRYLGDDLSIRIANWFDERYGRRTMIDNIDGRVVVLLRGDPWLVELPWILGGGSGINFVCEFGRPTTLATKPVAYRIGESPPPPSDYNVLDAVVDLPSGLAKTLTGDECKNILNAFLIGRSAYTALRQSARHGLVAVLHGDLEAAVSHLSSKSLQTGLSRWASLQAAEKVLKAYLEAVRGSYKTGHKLKDIMGEAAASGLPPINPDWIDAIQCSASVRYSEPVTLSDAITAHHRSLEVVAHVLRHLPPTS